MILARRMIPFHIPFQTVLKINKKENALHFVLNDMIVASCDLLYFYFVIEVNLFAEARATDGGQCCAKKKNCGTQCILFFSSLFFVFLQRDSNIKFILYKLVGGLV